MERNQVLTESPERLHYRGGDNVADFRLPGLKCGECNATLPRVTRTVKTEGFITRERICPKCGKINTTGERVMNVRTRFRKFSEQ